MIPQSILIVGGGTAGWMAANLLKHSWPQCRITLVESKTIGTIGVGEGSTPYLKQFFNKLGIPDAAWMPACNATYKAGIEFSNWSNRPGYSSYFHPFFSPLDITPGEPFFHNSKLQRRGFEAHAHPDFYFVNTEIAGQCRAPISNRKLDMELDYGYHFDAGLLGAFLKKRALLAGVVHIEDDVQTVSLTPAGNIHLLGTSQSGELSADFFIDCSGFKSLLLEQTLKVNFISYKNNLFNDAAVAIQTPISSGSAIPTRTLSTAMSNGWAWQIPLATRQGNGYVYSSADISAGQAEQELRVKLGLTDQQDIGAKHLSMKVGRAEKHWHRNCLAVGLSQGFIEPLEATALMLVQFTLENFIRHFADPDNSLEQQQALFNQKINDMFEGIRDYIVTHYKINSRTDSEYWRRCREQDDISDNLRALLSAWDNGEDFEQILARQKHQLVYLRPSWYVILAGMGRFPAQLITQHTEQVASYQQSKQYCQQLVSDLFPEHRQFLTQMNFNTAN